MSSTVLEQIALKIQRKNEKKIRELAGEITSMVYEFRRINTGKKDESYGSTAWQINSSEQRDSYTITNRDEFFNKLVASLSHAMLKQMNSQTSEKIISKYTEDEI